MKLLTKHYRIHLFVVIPILAIVSVGYYFLLLQVITKKADELLLEDKLYINQHLQEVGNINDQFLNLSDDYAIHKLNEITYKSDHFNTIMIYDTVEGEEEPYRQLHTTLHHEDDHYELIIRKSMVEYNSIMYSILILGVVFSALLALGFAFINRLLTKNVWSSFYRTLVVISSYSPESKKVLNLENSNIEEFDMLNKTVVRMSEKINNDFIKQKKFIDHVAHEIQTPLSVVNANIEILLQNRHLTSGDYLSLQNISESSIKLSKVVKSLLLLSRIDNHQFEETELINLSALFNKWFVKNEDLLENKNISMEKVELSPFMVQMNPILADILCSNLCQNAIRHSLENGVVWMTFRSNSDYNELSISNIGAPMESKPEQMFEMFRHESAHPESTGVGLSIVKEICNKYQLQIQYTLDGMHHTLSITKKL